MSSPQPITAMTARSWVIYKSTRAASCWVLTLFRVAKLLHEMAPLGVVLSADFWCCLFGGGCLFFSWIILSSFPTLCNTNSLSVPWCSGLESWRDKDSVGYLWFWGESGGGCGGGGGGGGVGGIFWFTLSWVKVVDRRMGAGDSQGVHGTEATGGATSSCCSWRWHVVLLPSTTSHSLRYTPQLVFVRPHIQEPLTLLGYTRVTPILICPVWIHRSSHRKNSHAQNDSLRTTVQSQSLWTLTFAISNFYEHPF